MILIWGNTRWAVWANLFLAALALGFGVYAAHRWQTYWGLLSAGFFALMALSAEIARRSTAPPPGSGPREGPPAGERLGCPDCGHANTPGWNFCSNCGSMRPGRPPRTP